MHPTIHHLFDLTGRVAVVTGGSGALGGAMARGLAAAGASVAIIARNRRRCEEVASDVRSSGGTASAVPADVLRKDRLLEAREIVLDRYGKVDILVNAAGGNVPGATLPRGGDVFGLDEHAFREVLDLNLLGTILPTQIFGEAIARQGHGSIVNVSSMAAQRTLTRVVGYSAAKAAIDNYTRWMAAEMARSYGDGIRVNAVAPGFFLGDQNRALLIDENGDLTPRGKSIIDHTPMGRFGEADELIGPLVWLCSDAAKFVTGIVVPVDGGFSAFSGI